MKINKLFLKTIIIACSALMIQVEAAAEKPRKVIASQIKSIDEKVPVNFPPKLFKKKTKFDNNINDISKLPGTNKIDVRKFKRTKVISGKTKQQENSPPKKLEQITRESNDFQTSVENQKRRLAAKEANL